MRTVPALIVSGLLLAGVATTAGLTYVKVTGLRSQPDPGALETRVARSIRAQAVPLEIKTLRNPVPASTDAVAAGRKHFARYCALCHGNDGGGKGTAYGRGFFPKAPDMRSPDTQNLTDGELFYIIENGVRFTGMPAFGTGTADPQGETLVWQLVQFIRRLPAITPDEIGEMESLNPL
jgi:mono/diheme cytochrome c family protein